MTDYSESTQLVLDTADRLLREQCTKELVDAAEGGNWPAALWQTLEETGLPRAAAPESLGGAELPLAEALGLLPLVGRHAAPVPLAETLIASALLGEAGCETLPSGPLALAVAGPVDDLTVRSSGDALSLTGTVAHVPFAAEASRVVVALDVDGQLVLAVVDPASCGMTPGRDLAGQPCAAVRFDGIEVPAEAVFRAEDRGVEDVFRLLALSRALMIAGAMQSILDLSTTYALERKQFGRPIAKFQAVQQQLAVLAGEAAAAIRAADGALEALGEPAGANEIAVAKARAGEAAGRGAEIAHQVHGAMGFTYEHSLHQRTRRLWAWRDEYGHEAYWQEWLGRRLCAAGADRLWALMTRSDAAA